MIDKNWCWRIDDGRLWSGPHARFVETVPQGETLVVLRPNGRPADVACLRDVVIHYGYDLGELAVVTADDVKAEANRRISLAMPDWMIAREVSGGDPIPATVKAYAQAVRDASDEIEAMAPIPADYTDDQYWPEVPTSADDPEAASA